MKELLSPKYSYLDDMNMNKVALSEAPKLDFNSPKLVRHRKIRKIKDKLAGISIGMGGSTVILAISLIFFYLLYEIMPLFKSAEMQAISSYEIPAAEHGRSLYYAIEEQAEKAFRVTEDGSVIFFNTNDGSLVSTYQLPLPENTVITSFTAASPTSRTLLAGLSNGQVIIFKHSYKITYPNDKREISPFLEYPFGESSMDMDKSGSPIVFTSLSLTDNAILIVGANDQHKLFSTRFFKEENFMTGEIILEAEELAMPNLDGEPNFIIAEPGMRWVFVATSKSQINVFDLSDDEAHIHSTVKLDSTEQITGMQLLLGGSSILVSSSKGEVSQWFMVRDEQNDYSLQRIRDFSIHDGANNTAKITHLEIEHRRKGFTVSDSEGNVSLFNSTAHTNVLTQKIVDNSIILSAMSPRANFSLFEDSNGKVHFWHIDNEHPEISFSALWQEVWYEGYGEPDYIWQSSAANNDFEPKYSLSPLAFGTLKAAFYAMLVATPLAICGALYTAYFMAPALRRKVKPSIELMEALPTVILGFLAGLFFAPFMEAHLPGIFTWLLITPFALVAFGFMWVNLPERIRHLIPDGWDPILLIPVVILCTWFSVEISPVLEVAFFGGDMRAWLTNDLGIDFDQRNALVVGAAMGFAVIPTIFSITEDAIFSVPKHLSYGSLALGATQWQTMTRVILPTASPGIFSAVMIGMGRAVGETMIVLMATGNTPIMDINIFEGMRTLSANIAVEMPESEVGSTHFRILFLAAFVLFIFTFVVNTVAEYVRQNLRSKYSVI
ncbi:MAG: phosphate transport system permease protein [Oleiphilaceae bacterium]